MLLIRDIIDIQYGGRYNHISILISRKYNLFLNLSLSPPVSTSPFYLFKRKAHNFTALLLSLYNLSQLLLFCTTKPVNEKNITYLDLSLYLHTTCVLPNCYFAGNRPSSL